MEQILKQGLILEEEQKKSTKKTETAAKPEDTTITVNGNVGQDNTDVKVDDKKAQETNVSVDADIAANVEKTISDLLVSAGWTKKENGTFVNDDFSDAFSAGISLDIQESKGFEHFAQQVIFEATGDINLTVKVKHKKTGKEGSFTHTFNAGQLNSEEDIREVISKFIQEEFRSSGNVDDEQGQVKADFFKAWEKLSEEEQDAFIEFYGDKLAKAVTSEK